ncbi:TPA: hypothetical protein ENS27_04005 [bacterium]|nr:hypothetical protein [bacterium]
MLKRKITLFVLSIIAQLVALSLPIFAQCTITFIPEAVGHGSIEPSQPITLNPDDCVLFKFKSEDGYKVCDVRLVDARSGVESDGAVMDTFYYCHDIPCDEMPYQDWRIILRVYFCPFDIKTKTNIGGSISPSGIVKGDYMSCQKFSITADPCWHIKDILLDGVSIMKSVTFTGKNAQYEICNIKADHEIEVIFDKDICYVDVGISNGGRIEPWGQVSVICGEKKTFKIIPDKCYEIVDVLVDGKSVGAESEYEFSCEDCGNNQCQHTIMAKFEKPSCKINASSTGPGRIVMLSDIDPLCGDRIRFKMIPDDCCYIKDVIVNDKSIGGVMDYEDICQGGDFSIKAIFEKSQYTIKSSSETGGRIEPSGEINVECGANISLNIIPDNCYIIKNVVIDGTSAGAINSYEFKNIRSNHSIEARFEKISYKIIAISEGNGKIEPSGEVILNCGGSQKFILTPLECSKIKEVIIDGQSANIANDYIFDDVRDNHVIRVVFESEKPIIKAITGTGGNILPSGLVPLNCKDSMTFYINSDPSYIIWDVKVDGKSVGAVMEYKFDTVIENHEIEAVFKKTHNIVAKNSLNGKITPSGNIKIMDGENYTFRIEPDLCYEISDVMVDGVSVGVFDEYVFYNVASDHNIEAKFVKKSFIINAFADDNGKIEPNGDVIVGCNEDQLFAITPNDCYRVKDVLVDGKSIGVVEFYKFTAVNESHTISAIFEKNQYIIDALSETGGKIEPSGKINVLCGESIKFTIKPDDCYMIKDVIIGDKSIGAINEYEFADVKSDQTIKVIFEKIQYIILASAGENGNIEPSGEIKISCGDESKFTIKSNDGYLIDDVIIDGKSISIEPDKEIFAYTFDKVDSDHKISAKFKEKKITAVESDKDKLLPFGKVKTENNGYIGERLPTVNELLQNYPNPFNPETWIPYSLVNASDVSIKVYDSKGCMIRLIDIGYKEAGFYVSKDKSAYWDGKNDFGEEVSSGIYFYTIQAGDFFGIKKMLIQR